MAKKEKKDGTKETITLMRWLISQIDGEAYRRGTLSGERHPMVDQKLIRLLGGQKNLLSQARELERDIVLGQSGKIRLEWRDMNMDKKDSLFHRYYAGTLQKRRNGRPEMQTVAVYFPDEEMEREGRRYLACRLLCRRDL